MPAVVVAIGGWSAERGKGHVAAATPDEQTAVLLASLEFANCGGQILVSVIGADGEYRWSVGPVAKKKEAA